MENITLTLTPEDVAVIGEALLNLPARQSLEVINKINEQIIDQSKTPASESQ